MENLKLQVESLRVNASASKLQLLHKCKSINEIEDKFDGLDKVVNDAYDVLFGVVK